MNKPTEDLLGSMREMLAHHVLEPVLDQGKWKAFYLREPGMGRMQSTLILFTPEGVAVLGDLCPGNDGRNSGVISNYGYGLSWFTGKLDGRYLCEKFLEKSFQRDAAAVECREIAKSVRAGEEDYYHTDRALQEIRKTRASLAQELRDLLADRRRYAGDLDFKGLIRDLRLQATQTKLRAILRRQELAKTYERLASELEDGELGYEGFGDEYRKLHPGDSEWYEHLPGWAYPTRSAALLIAIQEKFAELYAKSVTAPAEGVKA